jgi:hypothetical protein
MEQRNNNNNKNMAEKKVKIDKLFDEYRKSGLGLMTTVISLSSGGFIGLFQNEKTRKISFLYFIPIALALMQQLTHYLGSHKKAISGYHRFISSHTNNPDKGMDAYVDAKINSNIANLLFGISDNFCWISCLSLGMVTVYPLILFSSPTVSGIILLILAICLIYWFIKSVKLKKRLQKTDWFEDNAS